MLTLFLLSAEPQFAQPEHKTASLIERHLAAAAQAEGRRDYAKAAEEYQKIVRLAPRAAEIYEKLGLVLHLQSRHQDAILAFDKALALQPNLWASHLFLGIGYYKTNQFSRAIPSLQKALDLNPGSGQFEGRFWLGVSRVALGEFPAGIDELERALKLAPRNIEVLYNLAQAHKKYSAQWFDRLLNTHPESHRVYQLQAESYQAAGRREEAIDEYRLALARRPGLRGIHLEIGNIYLELGEVTKAVEEYESELRINPYDAESQSRLKLARSRLGVSAASVVPPEKSDGAGSQSGPQEGRGPAENLILQGIGEFNRGRWQEAAAAFERVLALDPEEKRANLYLARCLTRLGQGEKARGLAQRLLMKYPDDADALYALGKIHSELASARLQKMIEIEPESYRVHQMAGESLEKDQQYPKALESYKAAFARKPDLPGIRFSIGSIYWKTRQFDEAIRWLQDELRSNPHHAVAHYQLGNIYLYRGRSAQAVDHLRQAVRARADFGEARRELGKALLQAEQYEEAIEQLKLAAHANPDDDGIHALLASIYRKQGRLEEAESELKLYRQLNQKRLERAQRKPE